MQDNSQNSKDHVSLSQDFRDAIGTISKEGNRNYIFPQKPVGKLYNLRSYFSYV